MSRKVPREFWAVVLVFCATTGLLTIALAYGKLSTRAYVVVALALMVFPFVRYRRLFAFAATDRPRIEAASAVGSVNQVKSRIHAAKIRLVALSAVACFAMWETRMGPLALRLIGLGFFLLLLAGNLLSLQQARKALNGLNSGE